MILELEILEQCAHDERDFAFALLISDGDLERLKRMLSWQTSDGLIEIYSVDKARILAVSELKAIWGDDANFLDASRAANYTIRVTDAGAELAFG